MTEWHRVQTLQPEGHLHSLALPFQVNGLKLATLQPTPPSHVARIQSVNT